jgi:hypothetical protein
MKVGQLFGDYDKILPSKPDLWASTPQCGRLCSKRRSFDKPGADDANIPGWIAIAQKTRTQADYVETVEAARLA